MTQTEIVKVINSINVNLKEQITDTRYNFWSYLKLEISGDKYRISLAGVTLFESNNEMFENAPENMERYLRDQANKLVSTIAKIKM